jgi:hypothetical protein
MSVEDQVAALTKKHDEQARRLHLVELRSKAQVAKIEEQARRIAALQASVTALAQRVSRS